MERRPTSRNVSLSWLEPSSHNISTHLIQNTYARLKLQYADPLHKNWAEDLESPNQVFEQLSLAACLIELWRNMYNAVPVTEQSSLSLSKTTVPFPGFVDIACGNGILVYVLVMEGYQGFGYDACRRKSWTTFSDKVQECLKERVFVPRPFADVLGSQGGDLDLELGVEIHTGGFPRGTFVISDHADELTVWTPLMAALASPGEPLPFFVVPCCSRSLAGGEFRYPAGERGLGEYSTVDDTAKKEEVMKQNAQPESGDLKALRAIKLEERTETGFWKSMAGSLAAKTMGIAEEIGFDVERAWLRTPGAVNMALIGGWRSGTRDHSTEAGQGCVLLEKMREIVERECANDGGIEGAARLWVERTRSLRQGQGTVHQAV
jgi:tRNASer (uridine44-2'-O)-methyltransferase